MPQERHDTQPYPLLEAACVEAMFTQRKKMLFSIKTDIGAAFHEAIRAKVEYENRYLLGIIEIDAKMSKTRKLLNKTLKVEYFVQKPLDANII